LFLKRVARQSAPAARDSLLKEKNTMESQTASSPIEPKGLQFDLGMFEGFNFRTQSAIDHLVSAQAVVAWDHDRQGEAEFWPAGDKPEVSLLFKGRSSVTAAELLDLDRVLGELGGDSRYNFLQIHYAVNICGDALRNLHAESVQDYCLYVFSGTNFIDLRRDAAYELFELFYPDQYRTWNESHCDGLIFDVDRFLDSPSLWVEEVELGDEVALLVAAQ
jgi:hypothetical protein